MKRRTRLFAVLLLSMVVGIVALGMRLGQVAAAYKAQALCSGIYVSQRSPEQLQREELRVDDQPILHFVNTEIDSKANIVHGIFLGLIRRSAVYREGLGCTLAIEKSPDELKAQAKRFATSHPHRSDNTSWPKGNRIEKVPPAPGIDMARLKRAVDHAFIEPSPKLPQNTRAVVVVKDGRIILERYAPGIDPNQPLQGWSMTKTALNALTGILNADGLVDINKPLPNSLWSTATPEHRKITMDHLLRMVAGLEWEETRSNPLGDTVTLSWGSGDRAKFMAERPVVATPGKVWMYSSGTSYLLAGAIRELLGKPLEDYWRFPQERLFNIIGMDSAVIEPDETGTFGGGGFMYASPRDWARLGLLYLNDGIWEGKQLFPPGWVDYSIKLTEASGDNGYAAHLWRRIPKPYFNQSGKRPELPKDAYHMLGHWGQFVSVIPSQRLVVVRMGLSMKRWSWDQEHFLADVLKAFEPGQLAAREK